VLELQKQYYGVVMPSLEGLTPALVDGLIDYIEKQGGQSPTVPNNEQSVTVPVEAEAAPADVAAGRDIFMGRRRLSAGGPACISCHTLQDLGGLGGGKLAPDLTLVGQRLGHRQGLTAWLSAPATPTMASMFAKRAMSAAEMGGSGQPRFRHVRSPGLRVRVCGARRDEHRVEEAPSQRPPGARRGHCHQLASLGGNW
jgi:cytochrome c peroxidase